MTSSPWCCLLRCAEFPKLKMGIRSRSQKSDIKVSVELAPSGGSERESVPVLSPGFWWLLAILGVP